MPGYDDSILNEEALEKLTKLVASGRAICFVGAGLSAALGYPTWIPLVKKLEDLVTKYHGADRLLRLKEEMKTHGRDPSDTTEWCQSLKDTLEQEGTPRAYTEFIRKEFDEKNPSFGEIHEALVGLPFQHFFTSNFDPSLECAEAAVYGRRDRQIDWTQRDEVALLLRTLDVAEPERRIFHIHGRYDKIESVVLTSGEFGQCYSPNGIMRNAMWAVLSTKSLVFLGFSFGSDDVYVEIVRRSKSDLQGFASSHFAFLPIMKESFPDQEMRKRERERFRSNHGVEPIFYEVKKEGNGEDDHSMLARLVFEIEGRINAAIKVVNLKSSPGEATIASVDMSTPTRSAVIGSQILRARMRSKFSYDKRESK